MAGYAISSTITQDNGYFIVSFACAFCEGGYTTGLIAAASAGEARMVAEKEARPYFNKCHRCGSWVCDAHYNEDVMLCTQCAPKTGDAEK